MPCAASGKILILFLRQATPGAQLWLQPSLTCGSPTGVCSPRAALWGPSLWLSPAGTPRAAAAGVLLCRSAQQALQGQPWLGSFSVAQPSKHSKGSPGWGPSLLLSPAGTSRTALSGVFLHWSAACGESGFSDGSSLCV